jgi:hypothetical protein
VNRKDAVTHEIYLNDQVDLQTDGMKFLKTIEDILNDTQILSSKVTNYNHSRCHLSLA